MGNGSTRGFVSVALALLFVVGGCTRAENRGAETEDLSEQLADAVDLNLELQARIGEQATTIALLQAELREIRSEVNALQNLRVERDAVLREFADLQEQESEWLVNLERLNREYELLRTLLAAATATVCPKSAVIGPPDLASELVVWLRARESDAGDVPADTEATISSLQHQHGWWLFVAEFNQRFQPGIFALDPDGEFHLAWGGISDSEPEVRAVLSSQRIPFELALCVDVTGFIDNESHR